MHWFARDSRAKGAWKARRLRRLILFDPQEADAFGFIDLKHVIRSVHLMYDDTLPFAYFLNMQVKFPLNGVIG